MWNVWSAQKCQRLRVSQRVGFFLLHSILFYSVLLVSFGEGFNSSSLNSLRVQTKLTRSIPNVGANMLSFHSLAMFCDVFCLARQQLLLSCSLACDERSAYFLYCVCVFSRIEWVSFALSEIALQGNGYDFGALCLLCLSIPSYKTVPRSLENIALKLD